MIFKLFPKRLCFKTFARFSRVLEIICRMTSFRIVHRYRKHKIYKKQTITQCTLKSNSPTYRLSSETRSARFATFVDTENANCVHFRRDKCVLDEHTSVVTGYRFGRITDYGRRARRFYQPTFRSFCGHRTFRPENSRIRFPRNPYSRHKRQWKLAPMA